MTQHDRRIAVRAAFVRAWMGSNLGRDMVAEWKAEGIPPRRRTEHACVFAGIRGWPEIYAVADAVEAAQARAAGATA